MGLSILASFLVPILGPIWVPILVPILVPVLGPILVPILGPLWLQIKFFLWLLIALYRSFKRNQVRRKDGSRSDEKPFCGDKGASKHLAGIQSGTRELHWEKPNLTRIFPKCLLEVKVEKDFNICILDFWNCIFQDFSPILYRPKDLLACLPGCPWFINSSNIFAWLVFFETVQICKNKGDTAGVFEGKFFTDNLIA